MKYGGVVATKIDDWGIFKELEDLGYDSAWAPDRASMARISATVS